MLWNEDAKRTMKEELGGTDIVYQMVGIVGWIIGTDGESKQQRTRFFEVKRTSEIEKSRHHNMALNIRFVLMGTHFHSESRFI